MAGRVFLAEIDIPIEGIKLKPLPATSLSLYIKVIMALSNQERQRRWRNTHPTGSGELPIG